MVGLRVGGVGGWSGAELRPAIFAWYFWYISVLKFFTHKVLYLITHLFIYPFPTLSSSKPTNSYWQLLHTIMHHTYTNMESDPDLYHYVWFLRDHPKFPYALLHRLQVCVCARVLIFVFGSVCLWKFDGMTSCLFWILYSMGLWVRARVGHKLIPILSLILHAHISPSLPLSLATPRNNNKQQKRSTASGATSSGAPPPPVS